MATELPGIERLIADLSEPTAYPHPVQAIRVVQTHISCVFLTGEYAYKIKKPVDFGFLDYRTLQSRRVFCEQELTLNRRLCPDLYLNLTPVTEKNGQFVFGGVGEPVEWAVRMRQLREEDMLSARLQAGTVGVPEIERIARVLAAFHNRAAAGLEIRDWGRHGVVSRTIFNTLRTMETLAGNLVSRPARAAIRGYMQSFLERNPELFHKRMDEGALRDCHGDLRSQNICLDSRFDGGIQIFDCIEFNQEFRYIDIAADLAYLAMDLDLCGRADLRRVLVDSYTRAHPVESLREILPFYETYRAVVRGNIALFAANEPEIPEPERTAHRAVAAAAYDLAGCCARKRSGPALLITAGLSGSGKSGLAKELARRLPAIVLSSDAVRKERAGVASGVRLTESHYSSAERAEVYSELFRRAACRLAQGEHVLLDGTFLSAPERSAARQVALNAGAEFWMLECRCPDAEIRRRLSLRKSRACASDAGVEVYERQIHSNPPIDPFECDEGRNQFHVVVDTSVSIQQSAAVAAARFASE